ncbi:MAG: hypothetical protein N3G79_07135 [Sulfolobales archaeon]|nr:hypothetical protein [Sulfolobales archaeon]
MEKIEEIYSIGPRKMERRIGENDVEVVFIEYPLYPYLNYVATHLLLDKKTKTLRCWIHRDSWQGTGTTELGVIKLNEEEYSIIYEKIMRVKNPEDFQKIAEFFEEMMKRRKEEFDKIIEALTAKFVDAYIYDNALTLVKDEEILNELKKDVKQYISEWLTS